MPEELRDARMAGRGSDSSGLLHIAPDHNNFQHLSRWDPSDMLLPRSRGGAAACVIRYDEAVAMQSSEKYFAPDPIRLIQAFPQAMLTENGVKPLGSIDADSQ